MIIIIRMLSHVRLQIKEAKEPKIKKEKEKKEAKDPKIKNERKREKGQCYYPFPHLCFKVAPCSS